MSSPLEFSDDDIQNMEKFNISSMADSPQIITGSSKVQNLSTPENIPSSQGSPLEFTDEDISNLEKSGANESAQDQSVAYNQYKNQYQNSQQQSKNEELQKYPQFKGESLAETFPGATKFLFGQTLEERDSEKAQKYADLKSQGLSDSDVNLQMKLNDLKYFVKDAASLAPYFITPGEGLAAKGLEAAKKLSSPYARVAVRALIPSLQFGSITAISDEIKGLVGGESLKEATKGAVEEGGIATAVGVPFSMAGQAATAAGEKIGTKLGEMASRPQIYSKSKQKLENLAHLKKWLGFRTADKIEKLQDEIERFKIGSDRTLEAFRTNKLFPEQIKLKGDIANTETSIDLLENSISQGAKKLMPLVSDVTDSLQKHFSDKYNKFLDGPFGSKYVNMEDTKGLISRLTGEVSDSPIAASSEQVKKMGGWEAFEKSVLSRKNDSGVSLIETIPPKARNNLKSIFTKIEEGADITAKEAHQFKQVLQETASGIKSRSQGDVKSLLRAMSSSVEDAIDNVPGSNYKDLTEKYRRFSNLKDISDSSLGKQDEIFGWNRSNFPKTMQDFRKVIESGKEPLEDYVQQEYKRVGALFKSVDILKENGLTGFAEKVEGSLDNISKNILDVKKLQSSKKYLEEALKNSPDETALKGELAKRLQQNISKTTSKIKEIERANKYANRKIYQKEYKIESSMPKKESMGSMMALSILGNKLSSYVPGLKPAMNAVIAVHAFNKYGDLGASSAKKTIDAIESKISTPAFAKLSQPLKYATYRIFKEARDTLQEEEPQ